jgi:hypothetical protein
VNRKLAQLVVRWPWLGWQTLAIGVVLGWTIVAQLIVPELISWAHRGAAPPFLTRLVPGRETQPVENYLAAWRLVALRGTVLAVGIAGAVAVSRTRAATWYFRRFVGPATAEALGGIRILTCGICLASIIWEDVSSVAYLPSEMRVNMGMVGILNSVTSDLWGLRQSIVGLRLLEGTTIAALACGVLGLGTRWAIPIGAIGYLLAVGLLREYAWFYHTGLIPLYLLIALAFMPCGDRLSLDSLIRRRRGSDTPAADPSSQIVYGWCRHICWTVIALPYLAAGLSKLRNTGIGWINATNMKSILVVDTLNPMQFDFDVSVRLVQLPLPDVAFAAMAAMAIVTEVIYVLVLFSPTARTLIPPLTALLHVGILFLQNILFFDLILLQGVFVNWRRIGNQLFAWGGFEHARAGKAVADVRANALNEKTLTGGSRVRTWCAGTSAVVVLLAWCWVFQVEWYPLTAMQMYSKRDPVNSLATYYKAVTEYDDGTLNPAEFDRWIGAVADGRYRRALREAIKGEQEYCEKFFAACGERANAVESSTGHRIVAFEVQQWQWDLETDISSASCGRMVSRRFFELSSPVARGSSSASTHADGADDL